MQLNSWHISQSRQLVGELFATTKQFRHQHRTIHLHNLWFVYIANVDSHEIPTWPFWPCFIHAPEDATCFNFNNNVKCMHLTLVSWYSWIGFGILNGSNVLSALVVNAWAILLAFCSMLKAVQLKRYMHLQVHLKSDEFLSSFVSLLSRQRTTTTTKVI